MKQYRAFHLESIGASHLKKGRVCQDSSLSVEAADYRLAVVCDGHGGDDYFRSDRGSRMAVQAFRECAEKAFYKPPKKWLRRKSAALKNRAANFADALLACKTQKELDAQLLWFCRSVVARWNALVEAELAAAPFREEELAEISEKARNRYANGENLHAAYGTTLIGTVLTRDFWFGIQIGDGKCVVFDGEGNPTEPIPWDEKCFLNTTTSICDDTALQEFRFFFSRQLPVAVFVASDGIVDSFAGEGPMYDFCRLILTSFGTEEWEAAKQTLADYLPVLSAQGSGDDVSIGAIVAPEYLRNDPERFAKQNANQSKGRD